MKKIFFTLGLLVIISFGATINSSNLITITCSKDNTIIQDATGSLSNALGQIFTGRTNQDGTGTPVKSIRRGLIYFDIADSIPSGATIDSVRLSMYFSRTSGAGTNVYLHKVLSDWGEGTSYFNGGQGAPATQDDATWLYTFYDTSYPTSSPQWTTAGGDFVSTASASSYVGTTSNYGIKTWSSSTMTTDVQSWYDSPDSNYGWLIKGNESTGQTAKQFLSREDATPAYRPILKVYYSIGSFKVKNISSENTVKSTALTTTFSIYPNPATDQVTVHFAEKTQERIVIYNLCGGIVKTIEPSNEQQTTISLSEIKTGIYLIKAGTQTAKLVVK